MALTALPLGDFARFRGKTGWEQINYLTRKVAGLASKLTDSDGNRPEFVPSSACNARRRANFAELRPPFTFKLKDREVAVQVIIPEFSFDWTSPPWECSIFLAVWQVCGGQAHQLNQEDFRTAADVTVNKAAGVEGLWQLVRLGEQWWPLRRDGCSKVEGLSRGVPARGVPKARRRRPVPYVRECTWDDGVREYKEKSGLLAFVTVFEETEDGRIKEFYICPHTKQWFYSPDDTIASKCLPYF